MKKLRKSKLCTIFAKFLKEIISADWYIYKKKKTDKKICKNYVIKLKVAQKQKITKSAAWIGRKKIC